MPIHRVDTPCRHAISTRSRHTQSTNHVGAPSRCSTQAAPTQAELTLSVVINLVDRRSWDRVNVGRQCGATQWDGERPLFVRNSRFDCGPDFGLADNKLVHDPRTSKLSHKGVSMQQGDSTNQRTTRDSAQVVLEILRGRARHKYRRVHAPVFLIGKALDCDLVLGDPLFPDLHTYLFVNERGVTARYLGNGPLLEVDGVMQVACELKNLCLLKLGTYEFRVHVDVCQGRPKRDGWKSNSSEMDNVWRSSSTSEPTYPSVGSRAESLRENLSLRAASANAPQLKIYLGPGAAPVPDRKRSA